MEYPPPEPEIGSEEYNAEEDERLVGKLFGAENEDEMSMLREKLASRIKFVKAYEQGTMPTYSSYETALTALLDKTADMQDSGIEMTRKLAAGRMLEIRGSIRRYIENVAKFQHVKARLAKGDEADREKFIEVDRRRKDAHSSLIDTLRTTGRVIAELQRAVADELGEEGVKLQAYPSKAGSADGSLVFDSSFLENRDAVRDWAIAAWTIERIRAAAKRKAANQAA